MNQAQGVPASSACSHGTRARAHTHTPRARYLQPSSRVVIKMSKEKTNKKGLRSAASALPRVAGGMNGHCWERDRINMLLVIDTMQRAHRQHASLPVLCLTPSRLLLRCLPQRWKKPLPSVSRSVNAAAAAARAWLGSVCITIPDCVKKNVH